MKKLLLLSGIILFFIPLSFSQSGKWWKGNLHAHSLWSDGDDYPEMIMDWYKSNGYHFLALSDHNIFAEGEKWIDVSTRAFGKDAFNKYMARFGKDWVQFKEDSGKVWVKLKSFEEYKPLFEDPKRFIMIPAEEITDGFEGKPIHINASNIQSVIKPQGGNSVVDVMQRNLDAVQAQRKESGKTIIPHLNHPNFGWGISVADLMAVSGERFFEVYNGHPMVRNYGDSLHASTELMWDMVLMSYLESGKPPLYGIATDDGHNYHRRGAKFSNPGRAWIMVKAPTLTAESLLQAMEAGHFYASTGIRLKKVSQKNNRLSIKVKKEAGVKYTIQFIGSKKGSIGQVWKEVEGSKANYTLQDGEVYVRAKIISTQLKDNPYQTGEVETAWSQPLIRN